MKYPFEEIEAKWQKTWEEKKTFFTNLTDIEKKIYCLVMFIYPSGAKLHCGHWYNYGPTDSWARFKKLQGFNVFEPMGYDAFGLPAENYAIKTGVHPQDSTLKNIADIKEMLKRMGCMYDWDAEMMTCVPEYYKWNQWLFLQLYKKGLAYRKNAPVNWCPSCQTVLANEQVGADGGCERCGTTVIQKNLTQWFFKITHYAEELLDGLNKIDWPEKTKLMQTNWIGKSVGAEVDFKIEGSDDKITVFTTRPDTLFGVTYVVIAPEHPLVKKIARPEFIEGIEKYIEQVRTLTEVERTSTVKEKTGVPTGAFAVNPVNGEKIPVWVADYVLATYGTGCVMAVPGHDERDFEFAKKFNMPIKKVILQDGTNEGDELTVAFTETGTMINSGKFNGTRSDLGINEVIKHLEAEGSGKGKINYRLRDWLISRQRYWGTPIPIIHCEKCGYVPVPENNLPVVLPSVKNYQPRDDGESPLASVSSWVNVKCPKCKNPAKRETDTMPNWAGSSWYFLRYADPKNSKEFASMKKLNYWMPIDWYNGGMEHVTLHLLYSRFWNIFLHDQGLVPTSEPYRKRTAQGMILGEGGVKMSKSKGNVVNPDTIVHAYGADVARIYEMFMGPFDRAIAWDAKGIEGVKRFLWRVWDIARGEKISRTKNEKLEKLLAATVKKVGEDIEKMAFHTAVSAMMIFINAAGDEEIIPVRVWSDFLKILAPFAPHLADELWYELKNKKSVHLESWPAYDPKLLKEDTVEIVVQVNGKRRGSVFAAADAGEDEVKKAALGLPNVAAALGGAAVKKVVYVKGRIINLVM